MIRETFLRLTSFFWNMVYFLVVFRDVPGNGFSRVKVDRTDVKMKHILSKMVKKRGLKKAGMPKNFPFQLHFTHEICQDLAYGHQFRYS